MSEHRINKDNIIYIIPNDEMFEKWKNGEAFIDDYGRLMNRKPHIVLKELKHYAEKPSMVQQKSMTTAMSSTRTGSYFANQLKESVRENLEETMGELIKRVADYTADKLIYEGLSYLWHKTVAPLCDRVKGAYASKKIETIVVPTQAKFSTENEYVKQKTSSKMTPEEINLEKRKVFYHWLEMLNSLKKLQNAGEIDIDSVLVQLTDPAMLNRINDYLDENRNLLNVEKYITLHNLLGRNLYDAGQFIPIKAEEITTIAKTFKNKSNPREQEDDNYEG